MKLSKLKLNPDNPRLIKDAKFKKLVENIESFPDMLKLRPIIVDNDYVILGGNMRYRALKELGFKDIPDEYVKLASDLTKEEVDKFILLDNNSFGEWDYDMLANQYDTDFLDSVGLDIPIYGDNDVDYSDLMSNKNKDNSETDNSINKELVCCPKCGFEFAK